MKKTALITGIAGQDGSYLAEYLLTKNYKIYGLVRRHSDTDQHLSRIHHILHGINLEYGDILDGTAIERFVRTVQPDEVYHLAAQTDVGLSFNTPVMSAYTNTVGTTNVLEACRLASPYCKFYNAASSEIFGNSKDPDGFQRETTAMNPITPYGCSKLAGYHLVRTYRKAYKMFAVNGITFNHESPRRSPNFVTVKVIKAAKSIKAGKGEPIKLRSLDCSRDWGHAKDYVRAIHLMMHHKEPDDFVLATGETHKVQKLCEYVFRKLDLNYEEYITIDESLACPAEVFSPKGDASKARETLGWQPKYNFESLLDEMIELIN